jgi:hypothetical protein
MNFSYYNSSFSLHTHSLIPQPPIIQSTSQHSMVIRTYDNTRRPHHFPDHIAYLATLKLSPQLSPKPNYFPNVSLLRSKK